MLERGLLLLGRPGTAALCAAAEGRGRADGAGDRVYSFSGVRQRPTESEPAWCQPAPGQSLPERSPVPTGQCPSSPGYSTAGPPPVPRADPACPARQAAPPSGRARRPSGGRVRTSAVTGCRWPVRGKGAPPLTFAVGVEEAQGDQGAGHHEQQEQQPRLQEASVLLPRAAGDLHHPQWALGLAHRKSLDGESAQRRSPKAKAGAASTRGGASGQRGLGVALGRPCPRLEGARPFSPSQVLRLRALLPLPRGARGWALVRRVK